jgi:hypothetical protein
MASSLIYIAAIAFHLWLVWTFYQIYMAAWGRAGAQQRYIELVNTSWGQLFHPFLKWGGLVLLVAGAINLALLLLYSGSKLIIFFMGDGNAI